MKNLPQTTRSQLETALSSNLSKMRLRWKISWNFFSWKFQLKECNYSLTFRFIYFFLTSSRYAYFHLWKWTHTPHTIYVCTYSIWTYAKIYVHICYKYMNISALNICTYMLYIYGHVCNTYMDIYTVYMWVYILYIYGIYAIHIPYMLWRMYVRVQFHIRSYWLVHTSDIYKNIC